MEPQTQTEKVTALQAAVPGITAADFACSLCWLAIAELSAMLAGTMRPSVLQYRVSVVSRHSVKTAHRPGTREKSLAFPTSSSKRRNDFWSDLWTEYTVPSLYMRLPGSGNLGVNANFRFRMADL